MSETTSISRTSADAEITETPPTSGDHKTIEPPAPKKARFNKMTKTKRHAGVAYLKETPRTSLSMVPRRKIFPIFTSNYGCIPLSRFIYRVIQGRDFRLAQAITQLQLQYVLTISYCNRVVQTSIQHGYAFPSEASRLKQVAAGIQLPNVLAQYIESIGVVELATSVSVAPLSGDYQDLFPRSCRLMRDPAEILIEAGRPVPPHDWALDIDWIVAYNDSTSRASRTGMKFRTVDNLEYKGRLEMAVSYRIERDPELLLPVAPQVLSESEGQLGASYGFRNYTEEELWLGTNKQLVFDAFVGTPFDPQVLISDICVTAFGRPTNSE